MHRDARVYVKQQVERFHLSRPNLDVLEIGSLDVNGSVRGLFKRSNYTGIDLVSGEGVDIVADATAAPFPDESFDVVLCLEVLEHSPKAQEIIEAAHRMLRPSGVLVLTAAGRGRRAHRNENGEHYRNIHENELAVWMTDFGFREVRYSHAHKDVQAFGRKGGA